MLKARQRNRDLKGLSQQHAINHFKLSNSERTNNQSSIQNVDSRYQDVIKIDHNMLKDKHVTQRKKIKNRQRQTIISANKDRRQKMNNADSINDTLNIENKDLSLCYFI